MNIAIYKIELPEDKEKAFEIRRDVFVVGQGVSQDEEYDEYDATATHFLAILNKAPIGTARWRNKRDYVKLERFAILENHRNKGIGTALLKAVLKDIPENKTCILHAQLDAVSLYERGGFVKEGPLFLECGIKHYKMVRKHK